MAGAVIDIQASPESTPETSTAVFTVQGPPTSAEPHDLLNVRANRSDASTWVWLWVTVTGWVTASVSPSSSVTVSVTLYVPGSA